MSSLTLMQGYPGSGKTATAKAWVQEGLDYGSPGSPRARVSRDDLRETLFARHGVLTHTQEQHITDVQQDQVRKLLKRGYDVVVDDLNLRRRYVVEWAGIALEQQVPFIISPVRVPVDVCVHRDSLRDRVVGEETIRKIAMKFPVGRWPQADDALEAAREKSRLVAGNWVPYDNPPGLPDAYIIDLDGTMALKDRAEGSRGWHEYHRVDEDLPNQPVIDLVNLIRAARPGTTRMIFLSGRKDYCREQTRRWLYKHVGHWTYNAPLFMRSDDDNREDSIIKHELFDKHIRGEYHIVGCFDDRDRVVAMWRAISLQVYQVAPGNF